MMSKILLLFVLIHLLSNNLHADTEDKFKEIQQRVPAAKEMTLLTLDVSKIQIVEPCDLNLDEPDLCEASVIESILKQAIVTESYVACNVQNQSSLIAEIILKGGERVNMYTSYPVPALAWLDFPDNAKCAIIWGTVDDFYANQ